MVNLILATGTLLSAANWIGRQRRAWLLAPLALLLFWSLYGSRPTQTWNVFHYYLNSRYFAELGYTDLYSCAVERRSLHFAGVARDLETYEWVPAIDLATCPHEAFTAARSSEFNSDLAWLIYQGLPANATLDKGLNTSPLWLFFGELLANSVAIGSAGFWLVVWLDVILLALALGLVWWSRGLETAALAATFILGWYGSIGVIFGNWLQWPWLALTLAGAALWHKRRWPAAGLALGLAAGLSVFPAFLLAWPLLNWRRVDRRFWFGLTLAALYTLVLGSLTSRGLAVWPEWIGKIVQQSLAITTEPLNIGLDNLLYGLANRQNAADYYQVFVTGQWAPIAQGYNVTPLAVAVGLVLLVGSAHLARKRTPDLAVGLLPLFATVTLSRYYWLILVVVFLGNNQAAKRWLLLVAAGGLVATAVAPLSGWLIGQGLLLVFLLRFYARPFRWRPVREVVAHDWPG
ncbi:MAG: hypothetical protein L0331_05885 [Chloroflexi bacterium]|nr:hypothetical protein [Chloroflexota bacterium]